MIDTPVLCCEIIKVLLFRYSSYLLLTSATSWLSARGKLFSVEMLSCTEPNLPWDLVTNISDVNSIQLPAVSGMWETLIQKSLRESKRNTHKDRKKKSKHFKTCWPSMKFSPCSDYVHLFWAQYLRTYKQILHLSLKAFWITF